MMKKAKTKTSFICGLYDGDREYVINGVRYIVGSSFQTAKTENNSSITDRFKRIVTSDIVPLTDGKPPTTMAEEYVCSAAGEEA